jgi:hypothetical protein
MTTTVFLKFERAPVQPTKRERTVGKGLSGAAPNAVAHVLNADGITPRPFDPVRKAVRQ